MPKLTIHQFAALDEEIKTRRRVLAATSQPHRRNPTLEADQGARGRETAGSGLESRSPPLLMRNGSNKRGRVRFTHSPSTPLILTSEFFIAGLRILRRLEG
ncbi:uncharacterized protein HKW66_Vig0143570 [Vigna angularis]|uniref:Uncharacterized protein n=1 Tax=Phaseolus angularis TaxID=3914 RepID=A0A8T0KC57_PHAAN|nr:uncharacterized protein HKW66_Vig0143570 [Vigna angularis]